MRMAVMDMTVCVVVAMMAVIVGVGHGEMLYHNISDVQRHSDP
jgi:hypothetical protein